MSEIEKHIPSDEIRVQDLSIDVLKKDKERIFDLERDVHEADIKGAFEVLNSSVTTFGFLDLSSDIKTLLPSRPEWETFVDVFEEIPNLLYKMEEKRDWPNFFLAAAQLKIASPKYAINIGSEAEAILLKQIETHYQSLKKASSEPKFLDFFQRVYCAKILSPNRTFDFDNQLKEKALNQIEIDDPIDAIAVPAKLKMVFPGYRPTIKTKDIEKAHTELKVYRNANSWSNFMKLASLLKIASAEKILFTEEGMEFVTSEDKEDLSVKTPSLPTTKKYQS